MSKRQLRIGGIALGLVLLGLVVAQGMMGSPSIHGSYGQGMMGGMGMMEVYPPSAEPLSEEEARRRLETFGARFGTEVSIEDLMAFGSNYYAQIVGADGAGLAEVLVDRYTGVAYPEPGPNMMWNAQFGMMSGVGMVGAPGTAPDVPVRYDGAAAQDLAEAFLTGYLPGASVLEAQAFSGYYTFDFGRGEIEGMLSVNTLTGEVWIHNWHGPYLGTDAQ